MTSDSESVLKNTGEELETILIAVDSSNAASRLLSMAARVGRASPAATLHVLHVFRYGRLDRGHPGAPGPSEDALADAKEHLEYSVRTTKSQCRNQVIGHFAVGDPTAEILRASGELKAQLLVIGTHDTAGFSRLLLGSVAETLMRKAGCSVLVVRPTTHS